MEAIGRRLRWATRRLRIRTTEQPRPKSIPPLPSARGNWTRTPGGLMVPRLPPRPKTPPPLAMARAKAATLRTRRLYLERPLLHRDHGHDGADLEAITRYVVQGSAERIPPASPWLRYRVTLHLAALERSTPKHKWARLHRIDDVRRLLSIEGPPRRWGG